MRNYNRMDHWLNAMDEMLQILAQPERTFAQRPSPASNTADNPFTDSERKHVAGLMRVNYSGEICAQALYQGQALGARLQHIQQQMRNAAQEEQDHLAWVYERLAQLDAKPSVFDPLWYAGAFLIGWSAGMIGDRWSLGFVAETENQVSAHLHGHLRRLPAQDQKTKIILEQMQKDEDQHARQAKAAGAADLPPIVQAMMSASSKVMTTLAYWG